MKRILFFNDSMEVAGTEQLLLDLLNYLVKEDVAITLLLPSFEDKYILLEKLDKKIDVRYLFPQGTSYMKRKLLENVQIFQPRLFMKIVGLNLSDYDKVVCFKESFFARMLSKAKCFKVLWIHNILYKHTYESHSLKEKISEWLNKKHIRISRESYNKFDVTVCVSDACKESYLDVLHDGEHPKQDIRVIYNAIDLNKVRERAEEPIGDLPHDRINFVLITRVSSEKRIDRLVDSVLRLAGEGYNFHVYIVGDGVKSYVENRYPNADLSRHITYTGFLSNPYPYILQSDWSLCVSERESFSLVLLESMALNTPVITTDCGGPRNIVDNGNYGILVDNSGDGVYGGMKSVLDNRNLSEKYSTSLSASVKRFEYQGWLSSIKELLDI